MTEADFVAEAGLYTGVGHLRASIGEELKELYVGLEAKAVAWGKATNNKECTSMFLAL